MTSSSFPKYENPNRLRSVDFFGGSELRIVSYPKSGRTWLRLMMARLGIEVTLDHAGTGINKADWGRPFGSLPKLSLPEGSVLLFRDPVDVCWSLYHEAIFRQVPKLDDVRRTYYEEAGLMPPEDFERFFWSPRWGVEKALAFQLEMIGAHRPSHSVVVRYESLLRDAVTQLKRIAVFAGIVPASKNLERVVCSSTFRRMREAEASGDLQAELGTSVGEVVPGDSRSRKVREGQVGSGYKMISPSSLSRVKTLLRDSGLHEWLVSAEKLKE